MKKVFIILLAALMALTMAMPAMAAGYSVDPAIEQVPVEQKDPASGNISGEINQSIGSGSTGNVEINVNASAAGTENALPTASVAISKDSFRKIAKSGKDLVVNVTAPAAEGEESGKVVATYTVTSAQAAKIRKAVRLSTKTLSDAVIAKVKEACGENYLISAFKSTKLFGNMLVRSTVKVTLYTNASLKEIITSGKSQLIAVYKINEKTGKLTKVNAAVNSTLKFAEDGSAISFDINRGDSYAVGVVGNTDIDFTVVETTAAPVEETTVPAAAEETTAAAAEETTAAPAVTTAAATEAPQITPVQQAIIDKYTERISGTNNKLEGITCGFTYELTYEWLCETVLEEIFGSDADKYSVEFTDFYFNKTYDESGNKIKEQSENIKSDFAGFVADYAGQGDGNCTSGWTVTTITEKASGESYTFESSQYNGDQAACGLGSPNCAIRLVVSKNLGGSLESKLKSDLEAAGVWDGNTNHAGRIEVDLPKSQVGDNEATGAAVKAAILALSFENLRKHGDAMGSEPVIDVNYSVGDEVSFYQDGDAWFADISIVVESGYDIEMSMGSVGLEIIGK